MITINGITITGEQLDGIVRLMKNGWKVDLTTINKLPAEQCIVVTVHGEQTGAVMHMGIEADGYTHS
jgi:hypothetical protein